MRLETKIPLFSVDFDDKNILPEITERAVNYEKGCFVGQEIVARVKNLAKGITGKRLMFLDTDGKDIPVKNTKIMKDNNEVGIVTSAAYSPKLNKVIGFGFINKDHYESNSEVYINNNKTRLNDIP